MKRSDFVYTIKLKLIGFPKEIKQKYIELTPESFYNLLKTNTIILNDKVYQVSNKQSHLNTLKIDIVYNRLSNAS